MESLVLESITKINGTINLPGSKSISNRVLILAALAKGTTVLTNLLNSKDVSYMLNAIKVLGIHYTLSNNKTYCKIIGKGNAPNINSEIELFLGNAGTVVRILTAVLSLNHNNIVITGEPRMKKRPISHLVDALRQGGAKVEYLENEKYLPLRLYGGFKGGEISINSSISSQFLTALLIAAPLAQKDTIINIKSNLVSKPYIDITLHLINKFGVKINNQAYRRFLINKQQSYISPGHYLIEGDASSASYFLAAAAIKGGTVKVVGVGQNSIQGDVQFAKVLEKMGATIYWGNNYITCIRNDLNAINIDANYIPDVAMTIAIVALFAKGTTILRNIYNWRLKETDRLFAMSKELNKVGATVKEGKDFIYIKPPLILKPAKISTYNDHRIAMCFSLLALSNASVTIINPKCTAKTFPDYFDKLAHISNKSI